jgi:hypothetical protein
LTVQALLSFNRPASTSKDCSATGEVHNIEREKKFGGGVGMRPGAQVTI